MRSCCFVLIVFTLGCTEGIRRADVPITIALEQPVGTVVGYSWPEADGIPLEYTATGLRERGRRIIIKFPSGRVWMTDSNISFFQQNDGVVSSVSVAPLEKSTTFINALAHLRKTVRELNIADNKRVVDRIEEWKRQPPSWDPFSVKSLGCEVEPGINFFAEIKPAFKDGHWLVSYEFTVRRFYVGEGDQTKR